MRTQYMLAALAAGGMAISSHAHAHGYAGDHMFVSTLIIDDPNVADEASLPSFSFLPQSNDGGSAPLSSQLSFEFDKRITDNFGIGLAGGYQWLRQEQTRLVSLAANNVPPPPTAQR